MEDNYSRTEAWIFRWGWAHDTHESFLYLDEDKNIVWISCDKITNRVKSIWALTWKKVKQALGNNVLFWINNNKWDIDILLLEIQIVYQNKINKIYLT